MTDLDQKRHLVTDIPGPASRALMERRSAAVSQGIGTVLPVFIAEAGGGVLVDVDGNSLIDMASGIAVTSVGNSAPEVVRRVSEQVGRFTHACFMVTPYDSYVEVCEELAELTPGFHDKRSAIFTTGAEAIENAVKIARTYTGRNGVAVFDHAYHGRTTLTMTMTAKNMPYKHGFGPFASDVYRAPMSYPFRDPAGMTGLDAAERAIDVLEKQVGSSNLACLVVEPIQGEGGFIVPQDGFLPRLVEWCREHGIVFVADEVQSGFCRTGDWFACEHEGVVPDLVVTAKGIAGGLPLSAVTGRADIMNSVHAGGIGGTFGGNPLACVAALGSIATMRELGLRERAREIGDVMRARLTMMQSEHGSIGEVRGRGAMMAAEITHPGTGDPAPAIAAEVSAACHRKGVLTLVCGTYSNVLRFLPPLVIADHLLNEAMDVVDGVMADLSSADRSGL